jgi:transcription elongation factor Elf1
MKEESRGEVRAMNMKQEVAIQKKKQEIITKECCCSICGSKLEFTHFIDYDNKRVKESAICNECGVRFQTKDFELN